MTTDAQALADALALVEQLRLENQALRAVIAELEQRVADLAAENKALRDQLDQAQRQAVRQAAPFRGRDSKKVPAALWAGGLARGYEAVSTIVGMAQSTRNLVNGEASWGDALNFLPLAGRVLGRASGNCFIAGTQVVMAEEVVL